MAHRTAARRTWGPATHEDVCVKGGKGGSNKTARATAFLRGPSALALRQDGKVATFLSPSCRVQMHACMCNHMHVRCIVYVHLIESLPMLRPQPPAELTVVSDETVAATARHLSRDTKSRAYQLWNQPPVLKGC